MKKIFQIGFLAVPICLMIAFAIGLVCNSNWLLNGIMCAPLNSVLVVGIVGGAVVGSEPTMWGGIIVWIVLLLCIGGLSALSFWRYPKCRYAVYILLALDIVFNVVIQNYVGALLNGVMIVWMALLHREDTPWVK